MLALQMCDSVIFGGSSDQTSTGNFLSDLDPSSTARSKLFLLLMPCPSVFLLLYQASCIFLSMLSYFSSLDCKFGANFDVVGASYGWNILFVSLSDSKKNGFDTSLARIQSLSCISSVFSFPLPTVFLSLLEDNPAENLLV